VQLVYKHAISTFSQSICSRSAANRRATRPTSDRHHFRQPGRARRYSRRASRCCRRRADRAGEWPLGRGQAGGSSRPRRSDRDRCRREQDVPAPRPPPATLLGKGQIEELGEMASRHEAGLLIVDAPLTPVQQKSLEEEVGHQGDRPNEPDPRDFRGEGGDRRRAAAGRARPSRLSGRAAGQELDPPRAPARRLRLPRRPGETQIEADRR
jgi:hypothetical protein